MSAHHNFIEEIIVAAHEVNTIESGHFDLDATTSAHRLQIILDGKPVLTEDVSSIVIGHSIADRTITLNAQCDAELHRAMVTAQPGSHPTPAPLSEIKRRMDELHAERTGETQYLCRCRLCKSMWWYPNR